MNKVRSENGKFVQKSDEPRQIRSLRLTDTTWKKLGELADKKNITKADLIEEIITNQYDVIHGKLSIEDAKNLAKYLTKAKGNKLDVAVKLLSGIYGIELTKNDLS